MYLSFYNLSEKPFRISADPRFLWRGEKHDEAFANLKYGLLEVNGYVVLTGDVGTGKTTLVNALVATLDDSVLIANINHPTLDIVGFFKLIARAYDPSIEINNKAEFLIFFNAFLRRSQMEGKTVLLIIDEAHRLSKELLEEIRLFSNIEQAGTKLINIFFIAQDEFKEIIQLPECRALRQRITLFYDIEPLTEDETREYMLHRLKIAGGDELLFAPEAIREIHKFTRGYPRLINILCDRALLTGYVKEQREIDAAIIKECAQEMKFLQPVKPNGRADKTGKPLDRALPWSSIIHIAKIDSFLGKARGRLLLIGLAGMLTLIVAVIGIRMNFAPSGKNDVSAKPPIIKADSDSKLSVHQDELPMAHHSAAKGSPSVVAGEVDAAVKNQPQTERKILKQESTKVVFSSQEEHGPSLPATPSTTDVASSSRQIPEPTVIEQAAHAVSQNNFQLGIELLETYRKNHAGDKTSNELYAKALVGRAQQVEQSSQTEAESLLRKAVEIYPGNIDAHFNLGKIYTQTKEYPLAVDAYLDAVRLDPDLTDAFFNLGFIYAATGQYEDAEKRFMRVVELAPKYQDKALFNLALVQEKLGKREECLENLHKAVVLHPENSRAQNYLKKILGGKEATRQ